MPILLLISLQFIYYSLVWILLTLQIHPLYNFIKLFTSNNSTQIPDWSAHTNYFLAVIFLSTAISITFRLKVMKGLIELSIPFLIILWATLVANPDIYMLNLVKYAYIVLIPVIFSKVLKDEADNIPFIIKNTIFISLLYAPYGINNFLLIQTDLDSNLSLILTCLFTLWTVWILIKLFKGQNNLDTIQSSSILIGLVLIIEILSFIQSTSGIHQIGFIVLYMGLNIFMRWVQTMSKAIQ